jgi:hypothetical protein
MSQRMFNLVAGLLFGLFALVHAVRIATSSGFVVAGWGLPTWASAIAVLAGAYLALAALRLNKSAGS